DTDLRVVAAGRVEQARLAGATLRWAAEERVDRLLLRLGCRRRGGAGNRWSEAEVRRDDQRRVARDCEFVGSVLPALEGRAAAGCYGRSQNQSGQCFTHVQSSPRGHCPFPDPY